MLITFVALIMLKIVQLLLRKEDSLLEAIELTKNFGKLCAVNKVSFKVEQGEILGFLGNNGAGKSTTMKMLTGFLEPDNGTAKIDGHDILKDPIAGKKAFGYLPENRPLYSEMTVNEFLSFIADVRDYSGSNKKKRINEIIELCFLSSVQDQTIDTLSKGYKQRVGLALAIFHDPSVLIMDEPTDGLDPNQKHLIRNLILEMGKTKTIVLCTHILEEVEAVCSRTIIISNGKKLIDETPTQLKARSKYHNAVVCEIIGAKESDVKSGLDSFTIAESWELFKENDKPFYRLFPKNNEINYGDVHSFVNSKGWNLNQYRVEQGRLDEVFRSLTSKV